MDVTAKLRVQKCTTQDLVDVKEIAKVIRRKTRSQDVLNALGAIICYCRCLEHEVALGKRAPDAAR